jgi:nickel transport system ATP-binding protein
VERFCQRVLVMEHGRIVETATVSLPLRLRSLPDRRSSRRCCHLFLPLCLTRPCHAARNPDS